jgi:hypothetical protein
MLLTRQKSRLVIVKTQAFEVEMSVLESEFFLNLR